MRRFASDYIILRRMIGVFTALFLLGAFTLSAQSAAAQNGAQTAGFSAAIALLNQTPASRNPDFLNLHDIDVMRILDGNRQLVGSLKDMKIDEAGFVTDIVSEITWVGNNDEVVTHNISEVTFLPDTSAFQIPLLFESTQTNVASAEALAAIAPAAGGGQLYSLNAMKDAEVRSMNGRWVGKVENILMNAQASEIEALVLNDVKSASRYDEIAIPFDPEQVRIYTRFGRIQFRLEPLAAQAVNEYARAR